MSHRETSTFVLAIFLFYNALITHSRWNLHFPLSGLKTHYLADWLRIIRSLYLNMILIRPIIWLSLLVITEYLGTQISVILLLDDELLSQISSFRKQLHCLIEVCYLDFAVHFDQRLLIVLELLHLTLGNLDDLSWFLLVSFRWFLRFSSWNWIG